MGKTDIQKLIVPFVLTWLVFNCTSDSDYSVENALFELINPEVSGVHFNNHIEENYQNFFGLFNYVYNGGGVAIGDINNDDLADLYFTGNEVPNKLYLNLGKLPIQGYYRGSRGEGIRRLG